MFMCLHVKYSHNNFVCLLGMCAEDSFCPGLSSWYFHLHAARTLVQVVNDVIVVVGAVVVHVTVLQELWPAINNRNNINIQTKHDIATAFNYLTQCRYSVIGRRAFLSSCGGTSPSGSSPGVPGIPGVPAFDPAFEPDLDGVPALDGFDGVPVFDGVFELVLAGVPVPVPVLGVALEEALEEGAVGGISSVSSVPHGSSSAMSVEIESVAV